MTATPGITLRILDQRDARAYRALRLAGILACPLAFQPDYGEACLQPLSWAAQRLSTPGDTFFGAFDGGDLVGAVCLRRHAGRKMAHSAELKALVVDSQRQRQGIGRALLAHLIDQARAAGLRQLTLSLTDGNGRAERLYDAFGFVLFGLEQAAFLLDDTYYAIQHRQLVLAPD